MENKNNSDAVIWEWDNLAEITCSKQYCCDLSLLFEEYKGSSAKCEACIELIQSAIDSGYRMLVLSQFTSMLSRLEEDLRKTISRFSLSRIRLRIRNVCVW